MPVDAPRRLLIVEDDLEIRELMTQLLEEAGYDVAQAANGQEALTLLQSGGALPAAILLDLMMPVMDGIEFCARKSADEAFAGIPVIVMSAAARPEARLPQGSAREFITKPMSFDDVLAAVERCCRPSAESREPR